MSNDYRSFMTSGNPVPQKHPMTPAYAGASIGDGHRLAARATTVQQAVELIRTEGGWRATGMTTYAYARALAVGFAEAHGLPRHAMVQDEFLAALGA